MTSSLLLSAFVHLNFQCLKPIPAHQLSFVIPVFALLGGEGASILALSMLISYLVWILGSPQQLPRFGEMLMYIKRLVQHLFPCPLLVEKEAEQGGDFHPD